MAALAAERRVQLAPHSPYFGPGALATLHLLAALAPEARFEYFYLQPDAWLYGDLLAPRCGELRAAGAGAGGRSGSGRDTPLPGGLSGPPISGR